MEVLVLNGIELTAHLPSENGGNSLFQSKPGESFWDKALVIVAIENRSNMLSFAELGDLYCDLLNRRLYPISLLFTPPLNFLVGVRSLPPIHAGFAFSVLTDPL